MTAGHRVTLTARNRLGATIGAAKAAEKAGDDANMRGSTMLRS